MQYQQHIGAHWRVNLPLGWRRVQTLPSGLTYFESSDQRFGLYVAVWEVQDQHRSPDETITEFVRSEIQALDDMLEHVWSHAQHMTGPGQALTDSFEHARTYRVVSRLVAQLPLVLRACFHDYSCQSLPDSNRILELLLENVMLDTK